MLRSIATLTTGPVFTTAFGTDWPLRQACRGVDRDQGSPLDVAGFEMGMVFFGDYFIVNQAV